MRPIDPVVVREKQERHAKLGERVRKTKLAMDALAWFAEHGINKDHRDRVDPSALIPSDGLGGSKAPKLIVASSTTGADQASYYVERAYVAMRQAILERAIELAQADLEANEVTERSS